MIEVLTPIAYVEVDGGIWHPVVVDSNHDFVIKAYGIMFRIGNKDKGLILYADGSARQADPDEIRLYRPKKVTG